MICLWPSCPFSALDLPADPIKDILVFVLQIDQLQHFLIRQLTLRLIEHRITDAIMTLAREGFSGAHIARHCGVSEATVSREFSRQFPKSIPLKERRQRYEASAACTRYREKRKRSKPKGKLFPLVIETAEKFFR